MSDYEFSQDVKSMFDNLQEYADCRDSLSEYHRKSLAKIFRVKFITNAINFCMCGTVLSCEDVTHALTFKMASDSNKYGGYIAQFDKTCNIICGSEAISSKLKGIYEVFDSKSGAANGSKELLQFAETLMDNEIGTVLPSIANDILECLSLHYIDGKDLEVSIFIFEIVLSYYGYPLVWPSAETDKIYAAISDFITSGTIDTFLRVLDEALDDSLDAARHDELLGIMLRRNSSKD